MTERPDDDATEDAAVDATHEDATADAPAAETGSRRVHVRAGVLIESLRTAAA